MGLVGGRVALVVCTPSSSFVFLPQLPALACSSAAACFLPHMAHCKRPVPHGSAAGCSAHSPVPFPPCRSLQGSAEFKAWQSAKKARQVALRAAKSAGGLPQLTVALLLLAFAAGSAGVWRATRPTAGPSPAAELAAAGRGEALWQVPAAGQAAGGWEAADGDIQPLQQQNVEAVEGSGWATEQESPAEQLQPEPEQPAGDASATEFASTRQLAEREAALRDAQQEATQQRAAAAELAGKLEAAAEAARASGRDASQLRQRVADLEAALAAAVASTQERESAGEGERAALAAAQTAAAEAQQQVAALESELASTRADASAAAQAAAQQAAALQEELAAAQRAAAEASAALEAARQAGAPGGELQLADVLQALQARALEQPWVAVGAAAAVLGSLLACMALAAAVARRRSRAALLRSGLSPRERALLAAQLERAQDDNEARVDAHKRQAAQAAAEEEEAAAALQREWREAAMALQRTTAEAEAKRAAAASPVRSPLAARSSNQPAEGGAAAAATAALPVLPASKADTPAAWLDLLTQRYAALAAAAGKAEAAAAEAGAAAEEAHKERAWGEDKVGLGRNGGLVQRGCVFVGLQALQHG